MPVVWAAHRSMRVCWGQCRTVRLLHFLLHRLACCASGRRCWAASRPAGRVPRRMCLRNRADHGGTPRLPPDVTTSYTVSADANGPHAPHPRGLTHESVNLLFDADFRTDCCIPEGKPCR
jgi:hypothetical protein